MSVTPKYSEEIARALVILEACGILGENIKNVKTSLVSIPECAEMYACLYFAGLFTDENQLKVSGFVFDPEFKNVEYILMPAFQKKIPLMRFHQKRF